MINKKTIWILLFICLSQNLLMADKFKITASHTDKIKNLQALVDGVVPASSTDYRVARHTFLPHQGTKEWYECNFSEEVNLKNVGIYWFDEGQTGSVSLPKSWKLSYFDGKEWVEAKIKNDYGTERDQFNIIELVSLVRCRKIKIDLVLNEHLSAGVLELKINLEKEKKELPFSDPNKELKRLKMAAKETLKLDVDEFNGYGHLNGDRPEFDGWLNKNNNHQFIEENAPKFLCSNEDFTEVFNYRWWMIAKRLKEWQEDNKKYYVFLEFPGIPDWASDSGAIPAPAGHQFYDLRWMRNPKYLKSYIRYWLEGLPSVKQQTQNNSWLSTLPRPQSHHYTSWMIDGAEALLKVHPDSKWRDGLLPAMENNQKVWADIFQVQAAGKKTDGFYKCLDMYDANEFTISTTLGLIAAQGDYKNYDTSGPKGQEKWRDYFTDGDSWRRAFREGSKNKNNIFPQAYNLEDYNSQPQAFGGNHIEISYPNSFTVRPSLNSYMYGNFKSLSNLYALKAGERGDSSDEDKSRHYLKKSDDLKDLFLKELWHKPSQDDEFSFYSDRGASEDPFFYSRLAGDNLYTGGVVDQLSLVRETVGYTPWYFNMIPQDAEKYDVAWKQFADPMGFKQDFGISTAEFRHDYFNEMSYGWNGRGWPFQNSVVYKAYANYLCNYKSKRSAVKDEDRQLLYHHINQYVELHGRRRSIGEWYLPRDGRYRMPGGKTVRQSKRGQGKGFGDVQDYFHSTFPDMLIEDLLGFKASHGNGFSVDVLLPEDKWDFFYLGDLRYHNKDVDIVWKKDWDPSIPGNQSHLYIWLDGKLVAQSEVLNKKLLIEIPAEN
jgi:hypothetical protein